MSKKIKIVYILNNLEIGGAERLVLDICRKLSPEIYDVYICTVNGSGQLINEFAKYPVKIKILRKHGKLGLNVISELYHFFKALKPQVVHTHMFTADTLGRIAAILARVPVIISTSHGIYPHESWLRKSLRWLLAKFTAKIIVVSRGVGDFERKTYKISAKKLQLIYNGIDMQRFIWRNWRPIDEHKDIQAVVVARLEPIKGHQYLIEAMPSILNDYPNFILNIVGSGSLQPQLEAQVNDLDLSKKVIFWRQRLDIEKILPSMDLFILPSLGEGLGLVLLEAQAVGLPVLSSQISGTVEVVKDGETGLLFAPQDPQSIAKSVKRLLADHKLQEHIVRQAFLQVKDEFTLDKMIQAYEDLYKQLLASK